MNKGFWATVFTFSGTIIGAGILGLPYVFSQSGFFVGLSWLVVLGLILVYVNLCIGEISLRTKSIHHLPGYAKLYLGDFGQKVVFFALIFGIYSALLAYLIGEGESLSMLFSNSTDFALFFGVVFWSVMTLLLRHGLEGLKKIESVGVIGIIFIILGIFIWFFPQANFENLTYFDYSNLFFPFGVILFSLLGFSSVPELRREIKGNEKLFRKAIIFGALIPIVLYTLFTFTFVSVLGLQVPEVATLAFGKIIVLLGIFTMLTSYFVLSFALRDVFTFDLNKTGRTRFFFVSLLPLIFYLIDYKLNLFSFVEVLSIGGIVSGGLIGISALIMNINSKKLGKRKPEYSMKVNKLIIGFLSLVLIIGTAFELI